MNDVLRVKVRENKEELLSLEGQFEIQRQRIELQKNYMYEIEKKTWKRSMRPKRQNLFAGFFCLPAMISVAARLP